MSFLGAIRSTAIKMLHPTNRVTLPPLPSTRLLASRTDRLKDELKVTPKPKKPMTGFNAFFQELSNQFKAENPELKAKDIAKKIGEQWRNLDPVKKEELNNRFKKDMENYKKKVTDWQTSLTDAEKEIIDLKHKMRKQSAVRRRLKIELQKLDYPTRNLSAFNIYMRKAIENRDDSEPYKHIFSKIVAKWKTMSEEERRPYLEAAKADKARYLNELSDWKKKMEMPERREMMEQLTKLKSFSLKSS